MSSILVSCTGEGELVELVACFGKDFSSNAKSSCNALAKPEIRQQLSLRKI